MTGTIEKIYKKCCLLCASSNACARPWKLHRKREKTEKMRHRRGTNAKAGYEMSNVCTWKCFLLPHLKIKLGKVQLPTARQAVCNEIFSSLQIQLIFLLSLSSFFQRSRRALHSNQRAMACRLFNVNVMQSTNIADE